MKPEPVLFSTAEIGWLQEANKRAAPLVARAEKASAEGAAIVNAALAGVLACHRAALPKDGRFQVFRDQEGLPLGWRALDEVPREPAEPPAPTPRQVASAAAEALRGRADHEANEKTKKALLQAAEDAMTAGHAAEVAAEAAKEAAHAH